MTDYIGRALEEINPCGIAGRPSSQCKYAPDCAALGRQSGKFLCLPNMAYQVAQYLIKGSPVETERGDLRGHVAGLIGITVIDPKQTPLLRTRLAGADIGKIVDDIISRGQELSNRASGIGSGRDPLNFDCSVEHILADL